MAVSSSMLFAVEGLDICRDLPPLIPGVIDSRVIANVKVERDGIAEMLRVGPFWSHVHTEFYGISPDGARATAERVPHTYPGKWHVKAGWTYTISQGANGIFCPERYAIEFTLPQ